MPELVTVPIRYTKLSPRPLAQYSDREIRHSGLPAVVRYRVVGWQAFRRIATLQGEVEYFDTWNEAIDWVLENAEVDHA